MIFTPYSELLKAVPQLDVEDDASQSSTFDVEAFSCPKLKETPAQPAKKSVFIDESQNTFYETEYPAEECSQRWYSAFEYQHFRSVISYSVKYLQRGPAMADQLVPAHDVLENTYNACTGMLYEDIEILCPSETEQLYSALQDSATFPIGLTTYATPAVRRDVRQRRKKVVSVVKLIQRTVQEQHTDTTAQYMRMSLESISRPSRLYAQLTAQTQAICSL